MNTKKLKKDSFLKGAFVATVGIIIVKVIGLLYVIPFNAIIGEKGGALYGYAYNIYTLFLSISSAGFPFAISKLTSEYNALNDTKAVSYTYRIAVKLISIISIVIFALLFIFAPQIGKLIIGNATGGNSYLDIAFVVRCVSFSILIVPFLSVTRGFLQGHKYISPTSISQIVEQIVRVIVIIIGSYIALKIFKTDLKTAVGIAVSGAFFGGLFAYLYLKLKIKNSNIILEKKLKKEKIDKKEIIKKIFKYSIPFIIISLVYNLYNTVDMILVSRTMGDILHYPADYIESVLGIFTTWGVKLNNILIAVITGLTTSLIPNIVDSYTRGKKAEVDKNFNKALLCILIILVPATLFLSFLSEPIWTLFYGKSNYGPLIYKMFVFSALFGGTYTIIVNTLQGLNKYKLVISTVIIGLLLNTILDVPLMLLAYKLNYEVCYGAVVAAIIGYSISSIISLTTLHQKYKFSFADTRKRLPSLILSWIIFELTIIALRIIVPTNVNGRLIQMPILCIYGIVCFGIYFAINYFNGNLKEILIFKKRSKNEIRNSE